MRSRRQKKYSFVMFLFACVGSVMVIFLWNSFEGSSPVPLGLSREKLPGESSIPQARKNATGYSQNTLPLPGRVEIHSVSRFHPPDRPREFQSFAIDPQKEQMILEDSETFSVKPVFSRTEDEFVATIPFEQAMDFYAGGEVSSGLRLNGRRIVTWNTDHHYSDQSQSLYESHPYILALDPRGSALGIIFDTTFRLEIDLSSAQAIRATTREKEDGALAAFSVVIINHQSPARVTSLLAYLTGYMPLPPLWSLGYHQSRWSYYPESEVMRIANTFRDKKIPCDVIWFDIHYMEGYRIFTFNKRLFPDVKKMNTALQDKGFHTVYMIDPGVKKEDGYAIYDQMIRNSMEVKTKYRRSYVGDVWPGACSFPDFTMPETRQWWSELYADWMALGIDGVWNDMNEPAVFSGPGLTMPADNLHAGFGGGSHARFHNVYGMLMIMATREGVMRAKPDKRPFVLSRANFLGGQKYGAMWTGDNDSKWPALRRSISMILNMGLSGQPFSGADIGGFFDNASPRLFARWMGVGTMLPFARGHTHHESGPHEPWSFGAETEAISRIAIGRRYQLLPYFYTLFRDASITGLPVARPLFFADPVDPKLRIEDRGFTLGEHLMVLVNVEEHGNIIDEINIPRNTDWTRFNLEKDEELNFVDQLPVLALRSGSVVPSQPLLQSTTEPMSRLILLVALNQTKQASGEIYFDSGDGFGYQQDDYCYSTLFVKQLNKTHLAFSIKATAGKADLPMIPLILRLLGSLGGDLYCTADRIESGILEIRSQ